MERADLTRYSVYLTTEYYKNNIQPYLSAFSEKCLWIGPAQGQIIRGKKALLEAFAKEQTQLTFALSDIQVIPVPVSAASLDVILTYAVVTYYPGGEAVAFKQRTELVWAEQRTDAGKDYRIRVCHISNEYPYDSRDTIYPNHFIDTEISALYTARPSLCRFSLKGPNNSYFFLSSGTIMWMASAGVRTVIRTVNGSYESTEPLGVIAGKYPGALVRVHQSYAVNPAFVASIGRFYALMEDGERISIPEKKYTQVRGELLARIDNRKA